MTNPQSMSKIKFAFFGTPELAAAFLDDLEARDLVPSLVVTTPDRQQGRGMAVTPPPVKVWAEQRGLTVLQPEVWNEEAAAALRAEAPDVFVVIYYGKVLPKAVLDIPKHGALNIHFSLLPRWRGTSPVRATIAADDREVGTSIILLDEKLDHGPLVAQKKISPSEWPPRAKELEELLTHESARLLADIMPHWVAGELETREQNHDIATQCPAYTKGDGLLNLADDAYKNFLKIRAFDTTVGTYTFFERGGKKIRVQILDAHLVGSKLVISKVKPEGKREMGYEEFLRSGATPA